MVTQWLVILAAWFATVATAAALPSYFALPPQARWGDVELDQTFGEAAFVVADKAGNLDDNVRRGHLWRTSIVLAGLPDDASARAIWSRLKPGLEKAGWTLASEFADNYSVTLRRTQGKEAWASLKIFNPGDIRVDLVEVSTARMQVKLGLPAPRPETIAADRGDIPYLTPPPGSHFASGGWEPDTEFFVTLPGQRDSVLVATGTLVRHYEAPAGMSTAEFALAYEEALKAAGWQIIEKAQGLNAADAQLLAHYSANGRDIWAQLHSGITFRVADAGRQDMAQSLRRDCKATLSGVFFDFDRATLKAESGAALTRARDAIKANSGLALEVQGHTDAVGHEAYNLKLSEARAQSVLAWLNGNGVPATQLTAKGYGKSRPMASNDTDEGRARNRRVELACRH